MIKKTLKWTGIIVLVLVSGATLATVLMQYRTFDAPFPNIKASTDTALIARGKHLALGPAHCADCHSTIKNTDSLLKLGQDPILSGGHKFEFPLGKFFTSNITSDKETGIGNLTDAEIARVLRYSVKKNGESVLPFMPYQNMSDEDLTAIISYLRTLKPVRNPVPENTYSVMGRVVKAFLLKPAGPTEKIAASVVKDTSASYGKYLVMSVANCNGCHTKRDEMGNSIGATMAGGVVFEEPGKTTLVTPNLTQHPSSRLYRWTADDFIKRFRTGRIIKHSHMPWESYQHLNDYELRAIFNFLKSVQPAPTAPVAPTGKA